MPKCYLLVDWIDWRGVGNWQRARIVPIGFRGGFIKQFFSRQDRAEQRARRWARKNNVMLV